MHFAPSQGGVIDVLDLTAAILQLVKQEKVDGLRLLIASEQAYSKVELAQLLMSDAAFTDYALPKAASQPVLHRPRFSSELTVCWCNKRTTAHTAVAPVRSESPTVCG